MKTCFVILMCAIGFVAPAAAQNRPVVVELFTSQGCSSCPPADQILSEIADQSGVVALSFHVDYWDYIGWADSFAKPLFTARQKLYAQRNNQRMVYTPQMIVQGQDLLIGSKAMQIADAIKRHSHKDSGVDLKVTRDANGLTIEVSGQPVDATLTPDVFVVELMPTQTVEIERGENKGKRVTYSNVVRTMSLVGGYQPPFWQKRVATDAKDVAIIVQDRGHGPILAAQILR